MPDMLESQSWKPSHVFLALLALRLCNALTVQTFFQPDEFFQVLEPAWNLVFGAESGAWMTWVSRYQEWTHGLRSSLHPWLFSGVYGLAIGLADLLQVESNARSELLIAAPKVAQAIVSATTELYTWRLARLIPGMSFEMADTVLLLSIFSPWQWFFSTRTMSNCLEAALSIVALYQWQRGLEQWSTFRQGTLRFGGAIVLATVACEIRPTNVIIWVVVITDTLVRLSCSKEGSPLVFIRNLVLHQTGFALAAVALVAVFDNAMHGTWVPPAWNFISINFFQSLAVFYGANRVGYYLIEGLPMLLTTALPFALLGMWGSFRPHTGLETAQSSRVGLGSSKKSPARRQRGSDVGAFAMEQQTLTTATLVMLVVLSFVTHKEVRFLYPLLPLLHILAAGPMTKFFASSTGRRSMPKSLLLGAIIVVNISLAAYMSLAHQRGVVDVTHFLRHSYEQRQSSPDGVGATTVGFMMPCHSAPWRSHLIHPGIKAWALTCEPPLNLSLVDRQTYRDEADQFYEDTNAWLGEHMRSATTNQESKAEDDSMREWPEYLVFFSCLTPSLEAYTSTFGPTTYKECWRGFNSHFHDDWRRRGDVVVWCR